MFVIPSYFEIIPLQTHHKLDIEAIYNRQFPKTSSKKKNGLPLDILFFLTHDCAYHWGLLNKNESQIISYILGLKIKDYYDVISFATHPHFTNQGAASSLLFFLTTASSPINTIALEVMTTNVNALHVYKKFGFNISRVLKNYYGTDLDALSMHWTRQG